MSKIRFVNYLYKKFETNIFIIAILFTSIAIVKAQNGTSQKKQYFQWNKKMMMEIGIAANVQDSIKAIKENN